MYDRNNYIKWSLAGNPFEAIGARLSLSETCVAVGRKTTIEIYSAYTGEMKGTPVQSMLGNDLTLVNDELLVVGEDRYNNRQGQVRIVMYNENSDTWNPFQTLSGLQLTESRFGWVVVASEDGNRIAISAPNASPNFFRQGYVQVMERDAGGLWQPLGSILYGSVQDGQFGFSLAMSGDGGTVVVGAPGTNDGGVRVYRIGVGDWELIGTVLIAKGSGIRFGRSVAVSYDGDRIVASSSFYDRSRGHARVFDLIDDKWIEQYDIEGLVVGDWLGWGNFGLSLSPDGSTLSVGSVLANNLENKATGAVNIFELKRVTSKPPTASAAPSTPTLPLVEVVSPPIVASQSPASAFPNTTGPTSFPTSPPYRNLTSQPSPEPTSKHPEVSPPSDIQSTKPTSRPTLPPTTLPSLAFVGPSRAPLGDPTTPRPTGQVSKPSVRPTLRPTAAISAPLQPTTLQTNQQSPHPSTRPTVLSTPSFLNHTATPLVTPTSQQSTKPSSHQPTIMPSTLFPGPFSTQTVGPSPKSSTNDAPRPTPRPTRSSTDPFSSPSFEPSVLETSLITPQPSAIPPSSSKQVKDSLSPGSTASAIATFFALSLTFLSLFL